jgi:hypothetical protein
MQYVENYWLEKEVIIVNHRRPGKIIWLDYSGELVKEFRIEHGVLSLSLLSYCDDVYYFSKPELPTFYLIPLLTKVPLFDSQGFGF